MSSLARLSYVKSAALLNESSSSFDDLLKQLLQTATAQAESDAHCGRPLRSATYTDELYTGDGGIELWPRNYPVTAVSAAKVWDGDSYETLTSTHYAIRESRYLVYPVVEYGAEALYGGWPCSSRGENIKLTYTAGYVTTSWDTALLTASFTVPRDLEHAIATMAALMFINGRGDQSRLGMASMSRGIEGLVIERYERGLPQDVIDTLNAYRRRAA